MQSKDSRFMLMQCGLTTTGWRVDGNNSGSKGRMFINIFNICTSGGSLGTDDSNPKNNSENACAADSDTRSPLDITVSAVLFLMPGTMSREQPDGEE